MTERATPFRPAMTEFLCHACMTFGHEAPMCNHDPRRVCQGFGEHADCCKYVGYRFFADDGRLASPFRCSRCHWRSVASPAVAA